ncbi:MAG TPA: thiamine phosphate synthase [Allosphingosinicella sp.]|nr:thiamine phosphate synthase [Allosphingosinicella sp.]
MHPRQPLPRLWMMTDERQGDSLWGALDRLPPGAGVVFRHYSLGGTARRRLFDDIAAVARRRALLLMLGGEPGLAAEWGADGSHGICGARPSAPGLLRSAAVHDLEELSAAEGAGADLVFVSPVFATRSHPGAAALGPEGFQLIAAQARVPVIALGGMDPAKARTLDGVNMYGWAAIDAWGPGAG